MTEQNTKPIRVLHVRTVSGTGGGPDKTILKSCEQLTKLGHLAQAFYILDAAADTSVLPETARKLDVRMYAIKEYSPFSLSSFRLFRNILISGNYDIVHSHEYKSNIFTALLARRMGFKFVSTVHGYNRTTCREYFYYAMDKFSLKKANAIITPTNQMQQKLRYKNIHVIPNGIEISPQSKACPRASSGIQNPKSKIKLLYLGRLSPEKDPVNLLRAFEVLKNRGHDVELTFAGDGPEYERIRKSNDSIIMPGRVADVTSLLAQSDILVNPSKTECMPNSILEAMSTGVPVVATNVGGVAEMIRDGIDGLLCPAANSSALADAIEKIMKNPELGKNLAQSAHQRVTTEFTFQAHIQKTLDLYKTLLS